MRRTQSRRLVLPALLALAIGAIGLVWATRRESAPQAPAGTASQGTANELGVEEAARSRRTRPARAAAPETPAPETPEAPPVRRFLRVVDPDANPVPGVRISMNVPDEEEPFGFHAATDASGEWTAFGLLGPDATVEVADGWGTRKVPLGPGETVVTLEGLPEVVVDVVDGLTGREVVAPEVRLGLGGDRLPVLASTTAALRRDGARHRLAAAPLGRSRHFAARVEVDPPAGFVVGEELGVACSVAESVRTVRLVAPVYPEAGLTVRLVEEQDGEVAPVVGAELLRIDPVGGVRLAQRGVARSLEPVGEPGVYRVRGLPAVPLLHVHVLFGVPGTGGAGGEAPEEARTLCTTTPVPVTAESIVECRVEEPSDEPFEGPGTTGTIGIGGGGNRPSTVTVRMRFLDVAGRPVRGATVVLGDAWAETRADGSAECEVPPGSHVARTWAPGVLPAVRRVEVTGPTELVLEEPPGRAVEVRVVDAAGRPAPFAAVRTVVVALPAPDGRGDPVRVHTDLHYVAGTEVRPRPLTDAAGRVVYPRVPEGSVTYTAVLGSARGKTTSDQSSVTVVLEVPKGEDR